ncbi:MAG: hypothetical protein LBU76_09290 [Azoarcus sp.]|jgi:hypothetical protein|nr:hypothetical protein [Azoarcus sp.]
MNRAFPGKTPVPTLSKEKKPETKCSKCALKSWLAHIPCLIGLGGSRVEGGAANREADAPQAPPPANGSPAQKSKPPEASQKSPAPEATRQPVTAFFQSPVSRMKLCAPPPRQPAAVSSMWATDAFKPPLPTSKR